MDMDFQKIKIEYEKKAEELQHLIFKCFSGKSNPTKEDTNALLVLNFEVQSLCELLLEKKAQLDPHLANEVIMILKKARSNTYNC